jgi:hypothetical protein
MVCLFRRYNMCRSRMGCCTHTLLRLLGVSNRSSFHHCSMECMFSFEDGSEMEPVDNVRKQNTCINVPSSQTFKSEYTFQMSSFMTSILQFLSWYVRTCVQTDVSNLMDATFCCEHTGRDNYRLAKWRWWLGNRSSEYKPHMSMLGQPSCCCLQMLSSVQES